MTIRLLVTGAPHSGTGYTSQLLVHVGVPCGHEDVYQIAGERDAGRWVAESSWAAAAYLGSLSPDVAVVHQVRAPLAWVDSYARSSGGSLSAVERVLPGFSDEARADPVGAAVRLYVAWNRLIEDSGRAACRYRVEDLDARRLRGLARLAGVEVAPGVAEATLARVPRDYNHHVGPDGWTPMSWGSLLQSWRGLTWSRSRSYGYDPTTGR